MKIFEVAGRINGSGEFILGSKETGSHACYLVYGVIRPGEQRRELKPGHGHEEIVLAVQGDLKLTGQYAGTLMQGQALHLQGDESVLAENTSTTPAVYVIAGGHSNHGHH
jgi:hypothetical protein